MGTHSDTAFPKPPRTPDGSFLPPGALIIADSRIASAGLGLFARERKADGVPGGTIRGSLATQLYNSNSFPIARVSTKASAPWTVFCREGADGRVIYLGAFWCNQRCPGLLVPRRRQDVSPAHVMNNDGRTLFQLCCAIRTGIEPGKWICEYLGKRKSLV